ncbi:MAG: hypothetical protein NVS2B5_17180 [Beijerinckiaceae bacterium]
MQEIDLSGANLAKAEATVRAYDLKSEVVLAALALSFNPILIVVSQVDASPYVNMRIGIIFCLFVAVMLFFLRVLWPVLSKSRQDQSDEDVFFLANVDQYDASAYLEILQKADLAVSYKEQVLKLHAVRDTKHARFQVALLALIGYLLVVAFYGIFLLSSIPFWHF